MVYSKKQRAIELSKEILTVLGYGLLQTIIVTNLFFSSILYGVSFYMIVGMAFVVALVIGYLMNNVKLGVITVGLSIILVSGLIYLLFLLPLFYGAYPIYLSNFNPNSYVVLVLVIFSFVDILGIVIGVLAAGYHGWGVE